MATTDQELLVHGPSCKLPRLGWFQASLVMIHEIMIVNFNFFSFKEKYTFPFRNQQQQLHGFLACKLHNIYRGLNHRP